ncbi:MAG: hypothetical protein GY913_00055 [Proteobacteria bacterium]|nr:hypothetical protein [Pseudomonadota bacterium]
MTVDPKPRRAADAARLLRLLAEAEAQVKARAEAHRVASAAAFAEVEALLRDRLHDD